MKITNVYSKVRGGVEDVYARLVDDDGSLVVSATLQYILRAVDMRGYHVDNVVEARKILATFLKKK